MFKQILGTILCTAFNVKSTPQKLVQYSSLYGTYVLRDDFTEYLNEYINNHKNEGWYHFEITDTEFDKQIKGLYSVQGNLDIADLTRLYIGIGSFSSLNNSDIDFYLELNKSSTIYTNFEINEEPAEDYNTLSKWITEEVATNTDSIKYHTLYFNGNINLTGQNYELFNIFYTKQGNAFNTYYNGYYHGVNAITWSNYTIFKCQIIVDNTLYSYNSFDPNSWYAYEEFTEYVTVPIYNDGWKVKDMNLYINGMIPKNVYDMLEIKGTFAYVQPPAEEVEFSEFFFGIIDAPLYYIWSLFNWELFGMNLFIAFCGLITMALIIAIVKKVV